MLLALTEDQTSLARTALDFVAKQTPVTHMRKLRDSKDERGYSRDTYTKMAELGWTGIPFSEADGGLGMGFAELILVTEALGRTLAPEPIIPSVLAGRALALAGNAAQKSEWLAPLIAGEKILALAHTAPNARYDVARVPFRAERAGSGYKLTGQAVSVWGGNLADGYVVAARTAGEANASDKNGISLFVLPASARGLKTQAQTRIDSLNIAHLTLEGVEVSESQLLGRAGEGYAVLARVVDEGTVALCGEMLGGMGESFERTRNYLRERRQFGVAIGSFQALKHRAARLYIELELSRSAVMAAARALDEESPEAAVLVSVAKARLSDAYVLVANEAVQMHGGIGMTDEHDIGFYMKRARASEFTFGDAGFHRDRFATLSGY